MTNEEIKEVFDNYIESMKRRMEKDVEAIKKADFDYYVISRYGDDIMRCREFIRAAKVLRASIVSDEE